MANDDGQLVLACILGFGGGIYTFLKGFHDYRKYRLVADTPEIHIRSIPMGLVKIRGEARAEETLLSPITHTPCYLFKVVVDEWRSNSDGGGEWKHVTTDVKAVKFYLQDGSGDVLVDPANSELDLPQGPTRKVGSGRSSTPSPQAQVAPGTGTPATDLELLQYVEQARLRHFGQMVGKGIGLISHASSRPTHGPLGQSFMSMLADPTGHGAEDFRAQFMKASLARKDPSGETTRLALEVWKHPQGTPEYDSALVRFGQAYLRAMGTNQAVPDASTVKAYVSQHPEALGIVAAMAGNAEPQSDPEAEKARQAALAFSHGQVAEFTRERTPTASGQYRLTEYCVLPGQTYDITGTCAENPQPRDEHDRNIIVKGTNEPTFLISSRTDRGVQSHLLKQTLWKVLGGAALAVVCLAVLLGKLGLL
ncbi:MAG: hypothetical protein ACLQVG_14345 [Terriglobia bacterium]